MGTMTPTVATCPFCDSPNSGCDNMRDTINDCTVPATAHDPFGTELNLCATCGTVYCSIDPHDAS